MDPKSPLVRVRDDGSLEPLGRRAEALFKGKPGLLRVVASSPDVLVLRRVQSEQDAGSRVLLAGEIVRRAGLGDVLRTIIEAGWTGELVITEGLTRRSLFIREATIIGAASNALNERIGAVMTRLGVIDPEQLKVIVGKLAAGKRFGEVAVGEGFLTREKLFEVVRRQAEEIVFGAMAIEDGAFAFVEGIDAAKIPARCHLDAREVLGIALERLAPATVAAIDSIEEPIAWFNAAFAPIVQAVNAAGKLGSVRATLEAFADESPIDRAVFARMTPEGTLDARTTADVLATLEVADPQATLRKRLYEYLVYALFVACAELPKDAERALLARVEVPINALTPRPPPVAPSKPALQRSSTAPIARVALKRIATHPALAHAVVEAPAPLPQPAPAPAPAPEPIVAKAPEPEPPAPVEPPAVVPHHDPRRIGTALVLVGALIIASGVVFSVMQMPVGKRWMAKFRPPPGASPIAAPVTSPPPPASVVVFAPASTSVAAPAPSPVASAPELQASKPASTVGTIRASDTGGHRVWIDGKLVGDTPRAFEVACGHHVVRVGSSGQPQMIDVPCGGEVVVELK